MSFWPAFRFWKLLCFVTRQSASTQRTESCSVQQYFCMRWKKLIDLQLGHLFQFWKQWNTQDASKWLEEFFCLLVWVFYIFLNFFKGISCSFISYSMNARILVLNLIKCMYFTLKVPFVRKGVSLFFFFSRLEKKYSLKWRMCSESFKKTSHRTCKCAHCKLFYCILFFLVFKTWGFVRWLICFGRCPHRLSPCVVVNHIYKELW